MNKGLKMLQVGDVIELREGHKVYATVPERVIYANRPDSDAPARGDIRIEGDLSYLAGRYVVYKTNCDGGGTGMGRHDVYPDGHHVFCRKLDAPDIKVDFYQSGCFTAMVTDVKPIKDEECGAKMRAIYANLKCIEAASRKVRWVKARTELLLDLGLVLRKLEEAEKSLLEQYRKFEKLI